MSPHGDSVSPSTIIGGGSLYNGLSTNSDREIMRLREELKKNNTQLGQWNECVKQARVVSIVSLCLVDHSCLQTGFRFKVFSPLH